MRPGNGNPVVLIACYGQMSRFMKNGFISRKIQFAQASSKIGKIGHIASSLTTNNDCGEALRLLNLSPIYTNARQATRLPYN